MPAEVPTSAEFKTVSGKTVFVSPRAVAAVEEVDAAKTMRHLIGGQTIDVVGSASDVCEKLSPTGDGKWGSSKY